YFRKKLLGTPFEARRVRVDPGDAGIGEPLSQELLDPLGDAAHRLQIHISAGRACTRNRRVATAVMTLKPSTASLHPMQHHMRGTVCTLADPSARGASQDRRVSSPVQEHQDLLVSLQPLFDGLHHLWRESLLQPQPARVDHLDVGHWRLACPTCKFEGGIAAVEGMVPRFQGWRCRTEYNRDLQIMATPYRQVPGRIPQAVLLLVRGIMLLINDDQAK